MNPVANHRAITSEIATYAVGSRYEDLPERVRYEAIRAFLNWIGCALGGSGEAAVKSAVAAVAAAGAAAQATLIGQGKKADVAGAAFANCVSSSALSYDDTHLATVTHPTGPVAAALLAWSETAAVSGEAFLNALALGIEVECRLSNVLLLPPARANLSLYVTGLTGPIGAAVALGRLMRFDEDRMRWAIGLAATQAAGFRAAHGSTAGLVVPAFGARAGVLAALLAGSGLDCSADALEGAKGFFEVFAPDADHSRAVEGLGVRFELLANSYKPYPCGIVVQPAIDACLDIASQIGTPAVIERVVLRVNPLTLTLTDRRRPLTPIEAQVSLHHWVAAALLRGSAGIAEGRQAAVDDEAIANLREHIVTVADPELDRDQARAEVQLADGRVLRAYVRAARGSAARPMTNDELDGKLRAQARTVLSQERVENLLMIVRGLPDVADVGRTLAPFL